MAERERGGRAGEEAWHASQRGGAAPISPFSALIFLSSGRIADSERFRIRPLQPLSYHSEEGGQESICYFGRMIELSLGSFSKSRTLARFTVCGFLEEAQRWRRHEISIWRRRPQSRLFFVAARRRKEG